MVLLVTSGGPSQVGLLSPIPTHQGCVHRPNFTLCLCSFSQTSMLFASSPMRMVSTQSMSSSTGATWLEVPSKCASGSLDKRGTPPWCRPTAQGSRGAPQVTPCLYVSSATSRPQGRADQLTPGKSRWGSASPGKPATRPPQGNCSQLSPFARSFEDQDTDRQFNTPSFILRMRRDCDACNGPPGRSPTSNSLSGPWAPRNISNPQ